MPNRALSEPLFIFGMARSGTSYLRRLVNSFPDVFLMYESKIIATADEIFQKE
ncbi:MAG: sulfotransferase, partial [Deltaproteobacteria bacterium]|nr:sulfotransferase [Deltaproteobacteria bacterium]